MKRYRIHPNDTSFYYSTCTIIAWLPVFQEEKYFQSIINSFKYCQDNKGLFLLGYVIMPNHLHLITSNTENTNLSHIMRDFRHYTSNGIKQLLIDDKRIQFLNIFKKAASNSDKQKYKIWKNDYHPIGLTSEKWFNEKMNYMHANPVRKGFVVHPEHWKYISARNWILDNDSISKLNVKCF